MKRIVWLLVGSVLLAPALLAPGCSLENKEGPDVTCAQLECGRVNACEDGIIAQCMNGADVVWHVCTSSGENICEEDWQIPGQFRCLETETDCEGCRPERLEGCDYFTTGTGGTGGSTIQGSGGGATSSSSAGGSSDGGGGTAGTSGAGGTGGA